MQRDAQAGRRVPGAGAADDIYQSIDIDAILAVGGNACTHGRRSHRAAFGMQAMQCSATSRQTRTPLESGDRWNSDQVIVGPG